MGILDIRRNSPLTPDSCCEGVPMLSRQSRLRALAVVGVASGLVLTTTPSFAVISGTPTKTWGTNGRVSVILNVGGNNILGGDFTSVVDTTGHSYPASRIA